MADERLEVVDGLGAGTEIALEDELVLGRASSAPLNLGQDPELSRSHARITRDGNQVLLEDLDSTNGTYLNGWRIPSPQPLSPGDRIQLGSSVLELRAPVNAAEHRAPARLADAPSPQELATGPGSATLYAEGVRKSYGEREILKGVDLEVRPGEIVGLLGHNGAGKTTFVSIVAGLLPANGGRVFISGIDALEHPREARRRLGIAPQDLGVYPTMTVRRNLTYLGEISGLSGRELSERVEEVAEGLSLTPMFDRPAGTLSGGQQRRLHTGMAMLHKPALLILDEPTVGADVPTRQEILELVRKLAAEGRSICYSTHYMPEIEFLGASVAILEGGRIIARGSIAKLIAKHASPSLELHFDGEAPDLYFRGQVTREASVLRVATDDPAATAADALARLGVHALRLRNVEIIQPSLESVYLALTQKRYSALEEQPDVTGIPAPAACRT